MKKSQDALPVSPQETLTRRTFLKCASITLATAATTAHHAEAANHRLDPRQIMATSATSADHDVRIVNSACLGCNARCGIQIVVKDGNIATVSGNPYHPYNTRLNPIAYDTPLKDSLQVPASVCGKAHDAANYVANPYRIIRPMKRSGARGSGKFEPIDWDVMIHEISEGGQLFAHLGETRHIPGIKDLNKDTAIDEKAAELGSVRNGFVFMAGRDQNGRKEFTDRFVKEAMGSVNRVAHTDICGLGFRMGNFALSEKKEVEFKADPLNAEYILVFGANIYEALQPGINTYGAIIANRASSEKIKFTIIDPRATNASVHADNWIPIKPGQDGAFAMGLVRWIIDNNHFNRAYLTAANPKAAEKLGHGSYSNASHLIITEPGHKNFRRFLRMSDLNPSLTDDAAKAYVTLNTDSQPVAFDSLDVGQLDRETAVMDIAGKSIRVKTAFRALKEESWKHSIDDYAHLAGVDRSSIEKVAREFTSYGTKAATCQYHGAGNYASGVPAAYAVAVLNALIGSIDRKGGYLKGGGAAAPWNTGSYDLKTFPGQIKPKGVMLSREKSSYESSSEYKQKKAAGGTGYPAKRPWFPFSAGGLCVETLSGIDQMYPYPCKILFTYFFNPVYSIPGGQRFAQTLKDDQKVPLHVSIDTGINESNVYADYIVPDITYPEGHYAFLTPHAPAMKFTAVRTPAISPRTAYTKDNRSFCLETFLIDLAVTSGLPGFGANAIPGKNGESFSLFKGEDYYLRGIANLAESTKVKEAADEEVLFVEKNYPVATYKALITEKQWRQSCFLLARGGVFNLRYEDGFDGEKHLNGIKRVVLYNEDLATSRNYLNGSYFAGSATYMAPEDSAGNNLEYADREYSYNLVTYKINLHAQSRSTSHQWAMEVFPENFVIMHAKDGASHGIKDNDKVLLTSHSNPQGIQGKVKLSTLVRPGSIAVSFHYGHTQLGTSSLPIKEAAKLFLGGNTVCDIKGLKGNPRLGTGILPNKLSRLDENLGGLPLIDIISGIPDFSSTRVNIQKVS